MKDKSTKSGYEYRVVRTKQVMMLEYFLRIDDDVYRFWKLENEPKWHKQKTPYKNSPIIISNWRHSTSRTIR